MVCGTQWGTLAADAGVGDEECGAAHRTHTDRVPPVCDSVQD